VIARHASGALLAAATGALVASSSDVLAVAGAITALAVGHATLRWASGAPATWHPDRLVGPLVSCWLLVSIASTHTFVPSDVSGGGPPLSVENVLRSAAFAVVGAVALYAVRRLEPTLHEARPPVVLLALPAWTTLSALWSFSPPLAAVGGARMAVTVALAWATLALARVDPGAARALVRSYLRWFLLATTALVVLGHLFGPASVWDVGGGTERFTWPGAHPLTAAFLLSVAVVIAAAVPARLLGIPPALRAGIGVLVAAALLANNSRQTLLAVVVAVVLGVELLRVRNPLLRRIGLPLVGAAASAAALVFGDVIVEYVLRGQEPSSLATGNGRLQLWGIGIRALRTPFDWLAGLGEGASRTVFLEAGPWAYSAHNSVLSALVDTGAVGVVALAAMVLATLLAAWRARLWRSELGLPLALLLVPVLVKGAGAGSLTASSPALSILLLVAAVSMAGRGALVPADPAREPGLPPLASGRDAAEASSARPVSPRSWR